MRGKLMGAVMAAALVSGAVVAAAAPGDSGVSGNVDGLVREQKFPAAVLVTIDGRRRTTHTAGVAELGKPAAPPRNGRVRAGSNTKTFVAVVVLQLVAEGKVGLDEPIEKYLPGLVRGEGIDGRAITVRQLLQHTTGLPNYTQYVGADDIEAFRDKYVEPRELLDIALAHPANFRPGERWEYSNTNYVLAGLLIERVTRRPLAEQVRLRVIDKIGLRDTYWPAVGEMGLRGAHPHGYHLTKDGSKLIDATELDPSWGWAAGQLVSTPADLHRFFRALLDGSLLPAPVLKEMTTTVPAQMWPGTRYGLGVVSTSLSCGGEYWGHGGDIHGYETRGGVTRDGRGAQLVVTALPTSAKPSDPQGAHDAVLATVDKALCKGDK